MPFLDPPLGDEVGPAMQESVHKWREQPRRLPEDAPNVFIVMFDGAGFGQSDTFGGDPDSINYLPITGGWHYTFHMYQPRSEILDGTWIFPEIHGTE